MDRLYLHPISKADDNWVQQMLTSRWGSTKIVSRGVLHHAARLPGYIAVHQERPAGLVTYHILEDQCEITTLDSLVESIGIGGALIAAAIRVARDAGCRRLWLITTNENIPAIRFYQKQGFHLVAVYPNAVQASRALKPGIPETGFDGIPIRDEIEFEIILRGDLNQE